MIELFKDLTFWLYFGMFLTTLSGFFVFSWWWKRIGGATHVYMYVTLFLGSEVFHYLLNMYVRYLKAVDVYRYADFTSQWFWHARLFFPLLFLTLLVTRISYRMKRMDKSSKYLLGRKKVLASTEFEEEILIVDNEPDVLRVIKKGMNLLFPNMTVYTALSAEQAIKVFAEQKDVNFVLTDVYLPGMNGFELCKIIRKECPWTIVVAMTGYPLSYELWRAREHGFDDYLEKPFPIDRVASIIKREFEKLERWKIIRTATSGKLKGDL